VYKVYLIEINDIVKRYKIGWTKRDVQQRLKQLQTGAHSKLNIIDVFESKWGSKIESILHRTYFRGKKTGEWFELTDEEVLNFKNNCEKAHNDLEMMWNENTWVKERGRFA